MLSSATSTNATVVRNYSIAAAAVLALSLGMSDLFHSPNRIATQNTLNGYGQYISAGLVSYAQSSLK